MHQVARRGAFLFIHPKLTGAALAALSCVPVACNTGSSDDIVEPHFEAAASPSVDCDSALEALPVETLPRPSSLRILAQVDPRCPGLSSTAISLMNTSDSAITIDALSISGTRLEIGKTELPRRLEPLDRMPVRVRFTPDRAGDIGATLTVASGKRCAKLTILGQGVSAATEDGLITHAPEVLDFGVVERGAQITQPVFFAMQSGAENPSRTTLIITSSSSQFFKVVAAPVAIDSCKRFEVPVTFLGSNQPTTADEVLSWEVEGTSNGITLSGLQTLQLIATVK